MLSVRRGLPLYTAMMWALVRASFAADDNVAPQKYTLQYKFKAGERVYWEVSHRARIRSTVGGSSQLVETSSDSTKLWHVESVSPTGEITLVHQVERVLMRHRVQGREETVVEVPAPNGKKLPLGYEQMAADVGVPLTRLVMDRRGGVIRRDDLRKNKRQTQVTQDAPMTIPLPAQAVSIGEQWSSETAIVAPRKDGTFKRVKLEQRFTLKEVSRGIATIELESIVLTPVNEPEVQAHLVQSKTKGKIKFDLALGRVIDQDLGFDEEVIGVPNGEASSMHYVMRFTERYLHDPPPTAAKQTATTQTAPKHSATKSSAKSKSGKVQDSRFNVKSSKPNN